MLTSFFVGLLLFCISKVRQINLSVVNDRKMPDFVCLRDQRNTSPIYCLHSQHLRLNSVTDLQFLFVTSKAIRHVTKNYYFIGNTSSLLARCYCALSKYLTSDKMGYFH